MCHTVDVTASKKKRSTCFCRNIYSIGFMSKQCLHYLICSITQNIKYQMCLIKPSMSQSVFISRRSSKKGLFQSQRLHKAFSNVNIKISNIPRLFSLSQVEWIYSHQAPISYLSDWQWHLFPLKRTSQKTENNDGKNCMIHCLPKQNIQHNHAQRNIVAWLWVSPHYTPIVGHISGVLYCLSASCTSYITWFIIFFPLQDYSKQKRMKPWFWSKLILVWYDYH